MFDVTALPILFTLKYIPDVLDCPYDCYIHEHPKQRIPDPHTKDEYHDLVVCSETKDEDQ